MPSARLRLSVMMFLQFFTWGAWFVTLANCLSSANLGDSIGGAYQSAPIAAIVAPLFLGLIADRLFPSQIVQGVLMLLGAGLMAGAAGAVEQGNGDLTVWLLIAYMLCYMPTLGLGNSISFANIEDQNQFPAIRVWGTIGWIVAGLFVAVMEWSNDVNILWLAAGTSAVFGLYSFTLPSTPPPAKGKPLNLSSLMMVDAFRMCLNVPFAVFMACSTLVCIPLAYYYQRGALLVEDIGFEQASSTMTLGQMSEIIFMLLVPFFFRRLGVKGMILVGMAAWALRYVLFAFGAPALSAPMILLAVALHGVCYDFFFVTGFMYTDQKADPGVRGQAQSMLVFFTQGIGMMIGNWVAAARFDATMTSRQDLSEAIAKLRPESDPSVLQSFAQMFSVSLPEALNPELLATTMQQWKEFWLLPAGMAAAIFVLFLLTFYDSTADAAEDAGLEEAAEAAAASEAPA